jgi:Hr1 repeat
MVYPFLSFHVPFLISHSSTKASEIDQKIQDVYKRIHTERKFLEASQSIRLATSNPEVLRRNDAKIREAEGQLAYFEDLLRELQNRKLLMSQNRTSTASSQYSGETLVVPPPDYNSPVRAGGARSPDTHDGALIPPKSKIYSNLDLIKAETPVTTARISRMLHQLEFKLKVEDQYKKGIDKMAKLYQADGDKKSRADAESKRVESEKKIQLLQTSLKRYRNLHILDAEPEEEDDTTTGEFSLLSILSLHPYNVLTKPGGTRREPK